MLKERLLRAAVATALSAISLTATADGSGTGANSWIGYTFGGNQAIGNGSAVFAGTFNLASAQGAGVGAGTANQANGISSLVIGGFDNRANAIDALVGAGAGNRANGARSIIVGGAYNLAIGELSFIGGGGRNGVANTPAGTDIRDNVTIGNWSFIGGGHGNVTGMNGLSDPTRNSAVVGGQRNVAAGYQSFVGGGGCNLASGLGSAVVGGGQPEEVPICTLGNTASGIDSFVGGGTFNRAAALASTVAGGDANLASGVSSTVGGGAANLASGDWSTVPGGRFNIASGLGSFAAGHRAKALAQGSIVFGDSTDADVTSNFTNTFVVAASGGIIMATNKSLTTGCFIVAGGGTWTCTSDRNVKRDFANIEPQAVLRKVAALPLSTWRYQTEATDVRHMGPTAQDFREAFGLGHDDKTIAFADAEGVALAAIQGLHQMVQEKDAQITALIAETKGQREEVAELRRSVELLLARSSTDAQIAQR